MINSPPIDNVCRSDTRVNNYLTHIGTGYIQCRQGNTMLKDTNICPVGYNSVITPVVNLNGALKTTCMGDGPFTCPLNVTPITENVPWGGTAQVCNILPTSQFTNVNGFKSKKDRNVENFSQKINNDKCKAR